VAMATLVVHDGPAGQAGRRFSLDTLPAIIGRDPEAEISLPSQLVSRRHARILCQDDQYFIEDLGSRNGVLLNGHRITGQVSFNDNDIIRIVDFILKLHQHAGTSGLSDSEEKVLEQTNVTTDNLDLYSLQSGHKLQVLLELSQLLSGALEPKALFDPLLEQLLVLFPRADRGIVVLCEQGKYVVQAQRSRGLDAGFLISRTIIRQALNEGVGILSADIHEDERFSSSATLQRLDSRTLLCVPLIGHNGKQLGALQLASGRSSDPFEGEDLHLLTTIGMQVAMVLDNLSMQEERVQQAQLRKELAMARQIQQSFLPTDFTPLPGGGYELFAVVYPAHEVSGDLYDFFPLEDGRLAFFAGDVSSKGMPAALFMVAVHALSRHLARNSSSPAATLALLNTALTRDNQTEMFVTLLHGIFDPRSGETWLASGGHPRPLLRHGNGDIAELPMPTGRLLGVGEGNLDLADTRLDLAPGDTLILYTDGITEAPPPRSGPRFGRDRLCRVLGGPCTTKSLEDCAERIRQAVELYSDSSSLHDDITLLLLRRLDVHQ
jgi:sigma-B regulation protein RsbU (phosphoserine phosphatase)